MMPRILIAGQSSGVGKTTVTLGLIDALRRRGLTVQPFKCGPDYIDPTYHSLAAGRPCRNLDTWMLSEAQMAASFARACGDAHIAIIEGVMGLFDGASYTDETGSAAHIAKLLGAPVLLVLDIGKLARSAGALALGYQHFDREVPLAGFILNRAGSENHARGCAAAIAAATDLPVAGWLSKHGELHIPERHLGLIPTGERSALDGLVQAAGDEVEENFDLNQIEGLAKDAGRAPSFGVAHTQSDFPTPVPRAPAPLLAVARDEAFSFYYPDNLELLEAAGARIHFFSPLLGEELPQETAGVYLGGGFPEVYAARLSQNEELWAQLHQLHAAGAPIYAECGGFMALTEALVDTNGQRWPMAGLVPGEIHMQTRLAGLGYRLATATTDNLLLRAGETVRGHEFHYSTWTVDDSPTTAHSAWTVRRRAGDDERRAHGYVRGNLLASYLHIHFGQQPSLAERFVTHMLRATA